MNLTLVISNPAQLLHGCSASQRLDQRGGSIGSRACDWLLHDRSASVRPQHCQIRWQEGRFCVTDQCGATYVNGHDLPLGRNTTVRLNDGDYLQVGEYRIAVHIQTCVTGDDDPRHLSQRSVTELFNRRQDELEDWPLDTLQMTSSTDPAMATCGEFERLCRPLDQASESDPLLAMQVLVPVLPVPDVLDLPAPAPMVTPAARSAVSCPPVRRRAVRMATNVRNGALMLACLVLGGCTMLGKVGQVIRDPSIAVGGPNDQPSRYSLSLYASDNVNLRLISPGTASTAVDSPNASPYDLNIQAATPRALTDKLHDVLSHLYEVAPAQSPMTVEPVPSLQISMVDEVPLGDYHAPGVTLSTPPPPAAAQLIATPIAFKVLQLSDDSLLINASAQALMDDLKKTLGSTFIRADDYLLQPGQFKFVDLQAVANDVRFIAVIADYHSAEVAQWKQRLRIEPSGRQYALLVQLDEAQVDLKGETR
ncbi:Type VI secretion lipoprotein [compost metagenome]